MQVFILVVSGANILKWGIIIPTHKGGSYEEPSNYRPIALTSHVIKIFEKVMRSHMISYLEENNLLKGLIRSKSIIFVNQ